MNYETHLALRRRSSRISFSVALVLLGLVAIIDYLVWSIWADGDVVNSFIWNVTGAINAVAIGFFVIGVLPAGPMFAGEREGLGVVVARAAAYIVALGGVIWLLGTVLLTMSIP